MLVYETSLKSAVDDKITAILGLGRTNFEWGLTCVKCACIKFLLSFSMYPKKIRAKIKFQSHLKFYIKTVTVFSFEFIL